MSHGLHHVQYATSELLARFDPDHCLENYFALLTEENQRVNLVSRETVGDGLPQLAAESLAPFERIDRQPFRRYLDIGSGGGFPSIPILLTQEIGETTLVERTQKKAAVLRRMADALNLNVHIAPATLEDMPGSDSRYNLITMRLVRITSRLLRLIINRLAAGGLFIYYAPTGLISIDKEITSTRVDMRNEQDQIKTITIFYRNI